MNFADCVRACSFYAKEIVVIWTEMYFAISPLASVWFHRALEQYISLTKFLHKNKNNFFHAFSQRTRDTAQKMVKFQLNTFFSHLSDFVSSAVVVVLRIISRA